MKIINNQLTLYKKGKFISLQSDFFDTYQLPSAIKVRNGLELGIHEVLYSRLVRELEFAGMNLITKI